MKASPLALARSIYYYLSGQDRWYNNHLSHFSNSLTGTSVAVEKVSLYNLIPELEDLSKASFYSYKGSLTTPPCYESVRWIVLKTPIDASRKDVRTFFFLNIYLFVTSLIPFFMSYLLLGSFYLCLKINFTLHCMVIRYCNKILSSVRRCLRDTGATFDPERVHSGSLSLLYICLHDTTTTFMQAPVTPA